MGLAGIDSESADSAAASVMPEKTSPAPKPIRIDNDGDLLLRVGSGATMSDFKVCSAAMRRASPVWKKMLFGPWAESKPIDGEWIVELPEDASWPTFILLMIIHGIFDQVPNVLTLQNLRAVLIVADKYDLVHVIRPWAAGWAQVMQWEDLSSGNDRICKIFAAWELGHEEVLSSEMSDLVFNLGVSDRGGKRTFSYRGKQISFGSHFGPPDLVEAVTDLRLSLIQTLLDFYHAEIKLRSKQPYGCVATYFLERKRCGAMVLGGILQSQLASERTSLPESASEVSESANELMKDISALFKGAETLDRDHKDCHPHQRYIKIEEATKKDDRWNKPLRPQHKERMAAQRKKTGL